MKRKLNWKPDKPDFRDSKYKLHLEMKAKIAAFPASVSLESHMPAVFDQLDLGSCTSQGIGAAVDYLQLLDLRDHLAGKPEEFDASKFVPVSRLFIYANERYIEGTPITEDSGAQIRDGITAIQKFGVCQEILWPYSDQNAFVKPSEDAYASAINHKIPYGYRVDNTAGTNQIIRSLVHGYPVVFGMTVYSSFMSDEVANTGIIPMPQPHEEIEGGHCMLIVGYDLKAKTYRIRNSWGPVWGQNGYAEAPMAMIENLDITSDCWTVRRTA